MATHRQIEANRQNALKSTGPVTPEGKDRARRNALSHGLAGDGLVLLDPDAAAVAERLVSWRAGYVVETDEQEWTFRELVVNAVRVEACRDRESVLRGYASARASILWDEDRRADAEDVAARLTRDPSRTVARLEQTAAGCRWLLERWSALADGADWSEARVSLAFDLMGVPADERAGDPWAGHGSPEGLAEARMTVLRDRLDGGLAELDDLERSLAVEGTPARVDPEVARVRRYEAACLRRYEAARSRLTRRDPSAVAPAPAVPPVASAPPPGPRPQPDTPPGPSPTTDDWRAYERGLWSRLAEPEDADMDADADAVAVATVTTTSAPLAPAAAHRPRNRKARRAEARRLRAR